MKKAPMQIHIKREMIVKKDNPQSAVQSVINVLKTKFEGAKDKELKFDEIAAEFTITHKGVNNKSVPTNKTMHQKQQPNKIPTSKSKLDSCSSRSVKEDSTEQTERYFRSELVEHKTNTNTINEKHSMSSIDFIGATFASENNLITPTTAPAKKHTLASNINKLSGAATLPLRKIQSNGAMLPPPPPPILPHDLMTSEKSLDYLDIPPPPPPIGFPQSDKFAFESETYMSSTNRKQLGNGDFNSASNQNSRYDAANAYDRERIHSKPENHESNYLASTSNSYKIPIRSEKNPGEIGKIYYQSNALYSFVKYMETEQENEPNEKLSMDPNNENMTSIENELQNKKKAEKSYVDSKVENKLDNVIQNDISLKSQDEQIPTTSSHRTYDKIASSKPVHHEEALKIENLKSMLDVRDNFIEKCRMDPFYSNKQYPQPWKVLSKISNVLAREMFEKFEEDLSFGEESFIRDFIDLEVKI